MNSLIKGIKDTSTYLHVFEQELDSSIETLKSQDDKLRSFFVLKFLADRVYRELKEIDVEGIEKRLVKETEGICREAVTITEGLKVHSQWLKDIIDALAELGDEESLAQRHNDLNEEIDKIESSLRKVIELRNQQTIEKVK